MRGWGRGDSGRALRRKRDEGVRGVAGANRAWVADAEQLKGDVMYRHPRKEW